MASLLIQCKIYSHVRDHTAPQILVFFKRMAADVDSKHLLFECKQLFLIVLPDIWQLHLILFFVLLVHQVKQRHLTRHCALFFLRHMIRQPRIHLHELLSRPSKTVKSSRFDKILDCAFVCLFSGQTLDEILQAAVRTAKRTLLHDRIDHRPADALDCRKSVADVASIYRKPRLTDVDIRRQNRNAHLTAGQNILCHLRWIVDHGCHQRCHKFHRVIKFQVCCLIRHQRIRRSVRFVERILREIRHLVLFAVCSSIPFEIHPGTPSSLFP